MSKMKRTVYLNKGNSDEQTQTKSSLDNDNWPL